MIEKEVVKFKCRECGGEELGYQKYVKCITPVSLQENNNIEYGQSKFDEDDYLISQNGFICMDCESDVEHCGYIIQLEKELLDYLTMDPVLRDKEQAEYDEQLIAQIDAQEEQKIEQEY